MHIVTLATCYNRKEKTLSALRDLHEQNLPENVTLSHVLVDDGSLDGTTEAVRSTFPDVQVIEGTGNLYWAGGMRYGWENSVRDMNFDALLVYNDDVKLASDAVNQLVKSSDAVISTHGRLHVIVGAFTNHDSTETTYGGCRRSSRWHPLRFKRIGITGEMEQVDTLNMNAALITSLAIKKTGFLSEYFIHSGADFEYGLKIRKAGGTIWQTPNAIGFCERNSMIGRSLESGISKKERFIRLLSDKEKPARVRARYYKEYGGILWPLLWVAPYLKILVTRQRKKK